MRLVLGSAAKLTLIGLVVGLTAAAALTRYLSTLLYAVKPLDPITFVAVPDRSHRHRCDCGCGAGMASRPSRSGGGVQERIAVRWGEGAAVRWCSPEVRGPKVTLAYCRTVAL